ncbi:hypothetical protein MKX01_027271 [Papaver californicum]|nr:hypothetical protein MKX01_027271 [Papaver californicum]
MSFYDKFLFPPPQSIFIIFMSMVSLAISTNGGLSEGANVQYSKFRNATNSQESKFSTRVCMLAMYTPSFVASIVSFFWLFPSHDIRFILINSSLTLHFLKRIFEVLFVHRYSGEMVLNLTVIISLSYCYKVWVLSRLARKRFLVCSLKSVGIFGMVICPEYLFEILIFIGIMMISQ